MSDKETANFDITEAENVISGDYTRISESFHQYNEIRRFSYSGESITTKAFMSLVLSRGLVSINYEMRQILAYCKERIKSIEETINPNIND